MYQALYRKYRPKRFRDVVGQEHITQTLRGQIDGDRLSHAYLFVGTRGTGKTTCAKILSRAVNCLKPADGDPCNECQSCTGIENGTILDVVELDAASNNGVDDVRALRDEAVFTPAAVKKRVYIIDEVHMLSNPAFNALLKILEEPPEHIIFILATTELHKVPATIQSRCQKFAFRRLAPDEISKQLTVICEAEKLKITGDGADKLAILADGSMRDGISLLDQCVADDVIDAKHVNKSLGLMSNDELTVLVKAIISCDVIKTLDISDNLYKNGKDMAALLNELSGAFRDMLIIKLSPGSDLVGSGIERNSLAAIAKDALPGRLFHCLEVIKNTLFSLSRTGISRLVLEMCLIRMCDEQLCDDITALTARVEKLESGYIQPVNTTPREAAVSAKPDSKPNADNPVAEETSKPVSGLEVKTISEPEPEVKPVSKQTPEPEPSPEPSAAPSNTADSDDVLAAVLSNIETEALRVHLNDRSKARATRTDNALIIKMSDGFSAQIVENSFMNALKTAVKNTFGTDMPVKIEVGAFDDAGDKQSKINDLLAFKNVIME